MSKVVGWKVWYDDGTRIVGRTKTDWKKLPDDGVLVVMLYYDEHAQSDPSIRLRRIAQGADFYWLAPGPADHIYGQSNEADGDPAVRYPGASVKRGRWTDDHTYKQVVDAAMADYEEDW